MMDYKETITALIVVPALALAARFLMVRLRATVTFAGRFGIVMGLFLLYSAGLIFLSWQTYLQVMSTGGSVRDYHHGMILTIIAANSVVLFAGFLYYFARSRRRLSESDKMKLMDI